MTIRNLIQATLDKLFGLSVVRTANRENYSRSLRASVIQELLPHVEPKNLLDFQRAVKASRSQFYQDVFAMCMLNFKKNGYFVEFGATDGITGSNSYILETDFEWTGILVEPARQFHEELKRNRAAKIDRRVVYSRTGVSCEFHEHPGTGTSGVSKYLGSSKHIELPRSKKKYQVDSVTLLDLLTEHNAPEEIDFLSIDTEGTEFEILHAFDFSRYAIAIICVEHNNIEAQRAKLYKLLTAKGYIRLFEKVSYVDDWYILQTIRATT